MKQELTSVIVKKGRLLPGLHGLRGLAALAVVLYHQVHLVRIAPPDFFEFIGRYFGYSVHLFFILSAFSLMYSTQSRTDQPNWLFAYFIKRFFRIAPLFYLMIALQITRQIDLTGRILTDFNDIFLNMTFTFGFVPFTCFVWGGWAVGVEMIFYAVFPVLILTIRTHRSALVLLFLSIIVSYFVRSALHAQYEASVPQNRWDWSYFAFASNMSFFAMGIYAYHLSRLYKELFLVKRFVPFFTVFTLVGLLFFNAGHYFHNSGRLDIMIWGLGFMALCVWQSMSPSLLIANKFCAYLGERSFSIYLLHPVIITASKAQILYTYTTLQSFLGSYAFFVCTVLIITLVLFCTEMSYRIIEVPGIRFGKKLINQRKYA